MPVLFVHARGAAAPQPAWLEGVRALGLTVYCHRALEGCQQTRHHYDELGPLLRELGEQAPDCPVILVRAGLELQASQVADLGHWAASTRAPSALTALSNAAPTLNPFAGLQYQRAPGGAACQAAVNLMGSGHLAPVASWPDHLVALSAAAAAALADGTVSPRNARERLQDAGGQVLADDRMFVLDAAQPVNATPRLAPHESARPHAWGDLSRVLQHWLDAGAPELPAIGDDDLPVTLHITHSWGGGVERWVDTFMGCDTDSWHLQLRSEGPQSGQGSGQRLALYAGDRLEFPLASRWLEPPILSVEETNAAYRQFLHEVIARYGVGRVIVSSLVGHSLEALDTGLATVQVLHDCFPVWPFLSLNPLDYRAADGHVDVGLALEAALARNEFDDLGAHGWARIRDAYFGLLGQRAVRVVAPSESVAALQATLDERWKTLGIEVIPHGFPDWAGRAPVEPRARPDGRLRLLVLGRIQPGKGQQLLLEALPRLRSFAQVYLLGAGKSGESFFGLPGVNVVTHYDREQLPGMLEHLGPHLAALISVVPETFSYTLSELQALHIPVIATRIGSFAERIRDGETGWLVDPSASELCERIAALAKAPDELQAVRAALCGIHHSPPADMVAAYNRSCPPAVVAAARFREPLPPDRVQASAAAHDQLMERLARQRVEREREGLRREVQARTEWALAEQRQRQEWVRKLEAQLAEMTAERDRALGDLEQAQQALQATLNRLTETVDRLTATRSRLDALQEKHDWMLSTLSWRLTRPFRVLSRAGQNFMLARAWNPLRWPTLLARLARRLATAGPRETLLRMQHSGRFEAPKTRRAQRREAPREAAPPAQLPNPGEPAVSIIIPAFNEWPFTARCLASLAEALCTLRFEVILVDDASTDETPDAAPAVAGLRYLRHRRNRGFIASCNRGAEEARGNYLVFLNNDTEVADGWLDALLEIFDRQPDAGLVGARLVYADGRLQECGGLLFRDGSGWNYGRGDDPDRPEYQFLRETDYCSGACLAVPTDTFRRLGGFDTRYAPAYYEDTDLAMRVRELGERVYVQPRATVIHHEGVTSGTDIGGGVKRYQAINQGKFLRRWSTALAAYPPPIEDPGDLARVRAARDFRLQGRILVIDATTPEPDQDSGSVRLTQVMRCFRELGYGVSFLAENRAHAGRYTRDLQAAGIEALYLPWVDSLDTFFRERGEEFDLVWISRYYVAANFTGLVRRYCPRARLVFDTVDLHYLREQRLAELEGSATLEAAARQTRRAELAVIGEADAVLLVSPAEIEVLQRDAPTANVHVLSNVHDVVGSPNGFRDRKDLFFVGGYQHPPNIDAAQWFVNEIWPLVREQLPEAVFHLIGSKAPARVRDLTGERMVFHGFVEDLKPYLDGCRLAVAPLRYGAGVKGKVNLSMSHGQPVVATTMAAEGMNARHEQDILLADSAEEFAAAVVRLYQDEALWNRLSAAAMQNVEQYFSVHAARSSITALLDRLELPYAQA